MTSIDDLADDVAAAARLSPEMLLRIALNQWVAKGRSVDDARAFATSTLDVAALQQEGLSGPHGELL